MFGKLKEKLKSWTKKVSKEAEEKKEEPVKTKKDVEEKIEEIPLSTTFNAGTQKFEPNLEKIKEIANILQEEIKKPERNIKPKTPEPESEKEKQPEPGEKGFFKRITSSISKIKISKKEFEIYSEELEMLLLENNVALEVAEKIIEELKLRIIGKELLKKEVEGEIKEALKEIIEEILVDPFDLIEKIKEKSQDQNAKPYVILFCGINGTGKTTTVAKIAHFLQKKELSCVLAAGDTFRAASIEQLKKHGEKLNMKVIAQEYGSDPAAVGFDAIKYAEKNFINCVLIDTAGRMHTSKNLLKEIEKVVRICKPDTKIFVGEAITGNDSIEQVKSFDWEIGIDGIILTKSDTDEKGGTALSVGHVTKKPILYLGIGQEYEDIVIFDKKKFIEELGL